MPIVRLALTDFRSYADAVIAPGPGFVVLTGENGAGKTNVLEAISLLAPGRGLRGATLGEMARTDGPGGFAVAARLKPLPFRSFGSVDPPDRPETAGGSFTRSWVGVGPVAHTEIGRPPLPTPSPEGEGAIDLGTGATAAAPERRQVRINGAPAAATALSEWLSIVWLTPAMDRLFTESAGGRRRFLDRLVLAVEPGHAVHAARYEAAMRARNRLLADERPTDPDWLAALEAQMAEHGVELAESRQRLVAALGERLAAQPEGPFARAGLALEGWAPPAPDRFADALAQSRARDAAAGRTLEGPHRADLAVTHVGKGQPAARCSTGEQKALLLGLVLAHAELVAERAGRRPILLLDEVAAHLDPRRRAALFERLAAGGGQVWMTGTEPMLFDSLGARATRLAVVSGRIAPA